MGRKCLGSNRWGSSASPGTSTHRTSYMWLHCLLTCGLFSVPVRPRQRGRNWERSRWQRQRRNLGLKAFGAGLEHPELAQPRTIRECAPGLSPLTAWCPYLPHPPSHHCPVGTQGNPAWVQVCLAPTKQDSPEAGRQRPVSPGHCSG